MNTSYIAINMLSMSALCLGFGGLIGFGWGYETAQRVARRARKQRVKNASALKQVDIPWFVPRRSRSRRTAA